MYTSYEINKIRHWESKASGHSVALFYQSKQVFQVTTAFHGFHMDEGNNKQVMKLKECTCTCSKWQPFRLHCSHALAICAYARLYSWQFVESYYRMEKNVASYAPEFHPIPHEDYWPQPDFPILHPNLEKL